MGFKVSTDGDKRPLTQNTMKTLRSRSKLKVTSLSFTFSICSTDLFTSLASLRYALTSFVASWHCWMRDSIQQRDVTRRLSNIFQNSVIRGQLFLICQKEWICSHKDLRWLQKSWRKWAQWCIALVWRLQTSKTWMNSALGSVPKPNDQPSKFAFKL